MSKAYKFKAFDRDGRTWLDVLHHGDDVIAYDPNTDEFMAYKLIDVEGTHHVDRIVTLPFHPMKMLLNMIRNYGDLL